MKKEVENALEQLEKIYIEFDSVMYDLELRGSQDKELQELYWTYKNADNAFCDLMCGLRNYCENEEKSKVAEKT